MKNWRTWQICWICWKKRLITIRSLWPYRKIESYYIPLLDENSASNFFASIGFGLVNVIGSLTNISVDYPDHWFLIATVNWYSYDEKLFISKLKEHLNTNGIKELENGIFQPSLNELIKMYEIKKEIKKEVTNYFVIEKVETAKMVRWFDNKEKALQDISETYNYNKSELMEEYTFRKIISIKDIIDFIKVLSDSYNLVDDNCHAFVKYILAHFKLDYSYFIPYDEDISPENLVFDEE